MFSFLKKFLKTGIIAGILVGTVATAAVLVAGPDRARTVMHHVHGQVLDSIDAQIDDPAALRSQLMEMEREYPKRIAQVRGDLAELNEQIRQLDRESAIAERVVELADADIVELEGALSQVAQASYGRERVIFRDRVLSAERAGARLNQIRSTRVAYSNRAADAQHDLVYLRQQSTQLQELMVDLENERTQFKGQIQALSRQVDAIARNERLIELLEKRNRTIEEVSRYEVVSLEQITGRLSEIRSRQEAELEILARTKADTDYEDVARMQITHESLDAVPTAPVQTLPQSVEDVHTARN